MQIKPIEQASPEEIAGIFVESWKQGYRGLASDAYLDALTIEELVEKWESWLEIVQPGYVAVVDGKAAGFISCGPVRTRPPGDKGIIPLYAWEIYALYVHPDYWRQGIAKALMNRIAEDLSEKRSRSLILWVIKNNKRAMPFYEKLGGQRIGKKRLEIGGMTVDESALGWRDTNTILEKVKL
ncbi:MAG: GNAT family N-acetyltransferase [Micavibrio sp.]|nr:GNAT family N-acetyltransferase [Micavibrio sp.]|tara:strand:- start:728 stop:1273 length:546 start_codon:yes stop_codon:yes gene_type:complete